MEALCGSLAHNDRTGKRRTQHTVRCGPWPLRLEVPARKLGTDPHAPIIVEQFLVRSGPWWRDALE